DGRNLTFELPIHPAGMVVDPATGVVAWQPTREAIGVHGVILRVQDGHGGVTLQPFQVTVSSPNTAPVITSTPPAQALAGRPSQYQRRPQDADRDVLSFRLDAGPQGMTIDPASGLLLWTPTVGQIGSNAVTVVVTDSQGLTAAQPFNIQVVSASANHSP